MKVLRTPKEILKHLRAKLSSNATQNNYAFYSSLLNGITTGILK